MALRLEITTPAYLNLEAKITDAEITEIYYARMVAAGISTKAASDNRRLTDALTGVDLQQTYVGKILSDTSLLTEAMSANIEQVRSESLNTSDTAIIALTFYRNLADAFAIDDAINLERIGGGITKHNVANASDAHYWATTKAVADAASVADSTRTALEKPLTEAMSTLDTISHAAQYYRVFEDALSVSDYVLGSGRELSSISEASISDQYALSINTNYADATSLGDVQSLAVSKALTEFIGVTESISFQFANDLKPVFNGVTFNSSTFG